MGTERARRSGGGAAMTSPVSCWMPTPTEMSAHFAVRHRVFVEEQGVMVLTDIDRWDRHDETIHVVAAHGTEIAGTVRLYPLDDVGRWKGDRLAVLPAYRSSLVGMHLVRYAVATAAAAGGLVMEASVQVANTVFFERLGWRCDGEVRSYYGLPHQPMLIDLPGAEPIAAVPRHDAVLKLSEHDLSMSPLLVPC